MLNEKPPVEAERNDACAILSRSGSWVLHMPGPDPGRIIITVLVGMAGASVGGFVVSTLGGAGATGFNVRSILVVTLGAVILLALYRLVARRTA